MNQLRLPRGRLVAGRTMRVALPGAAGLLGKLDLAATFVFALGGATAAADAGLDMFGILAIAFVSSLVGGIVRDVLIGDTPPATLRTIRFPVVAFAAGVLVILLGSNVHQIPAPLVTTFDAAGLGLFAVSGALKSRERGVNPLVSVLLGTVSGVGGGVTRDVLLNHVPAILRVELYAVPAAFGATVALACLALGRSRGPALGMGFACCFVLRLLGAWQQWNLPISYG